jgi:hypothetical protein
MLLKYYLSVLFIGCYQLMNAQSFMNIEVAQNFSTFKFSYKFIDNTNFANDYQQYTQINSVAYGAGYTNLRSSGLLLSGGLGFRKAGASLVYNKTNFLWELQYIDFKAGAGYLYNRWSIKPYASLMPYYAYLLNAKQSSGLKYYDIKSDNALKSHDLGLLLNVGLKVALSYYTDLFAEYNYNVGLNNIETAPEQFLYNRGFAVKLGLAINITNFKKIQDQINKVKTNPDTSITQQNLNLSSTPNNTNSSVDKIQAPGAEGWALNSNKTDENNSLDDNWPSEDGIASNSNDTGKTPVEKNTSKIGSENSVNKTSTAPPNLANNSSSIVGSENSLNNTSTATATPQNNSSSAIGSESSLNKTSTAPANATSNPSTNNLPNNTAENNSVKMNNATISNSPANTTKPVTDPIAYNNFVPATVSTNNTEENSQPMDNGDFIEDVTFEKTKTEEIKFNKSTAIQVEKTNFKTPPKKKETENRTKIPNKEEKIEFKIQLTAVKNSLRDGHPIYKNFKGDIKSEKGKDGWMRYYLGSYETYEEALKELKKIKAKGLADGGFIVAFKNSKKISVSEAKELLK